MAGTRGKAWKKIEKKEREVLKVDGVGNKKGGGAALSWGAGMLIILLGVLRDTDAQLDLLWESPIFQDIH